MSDSDSMTIDDSRQDKANLILVVNQAGMICSTTEAPDEYASLLGRGVELATIDNLWPQDLSDRVRHYLRRALRDRRSCSFEAESTDCALNEFLFVPRGRDRLLLIVRDLSEQRQALSRAEHLAFTDDATKLPNREYLFSELQKITDIQRLKEGRSAMISIHVGEFDDHGYALNSGQQDEVLKQLAGRMTRHLRGSNNDSRNDFERYSVAARTDYRQFCVVLPSIENGEDAEAVAARLIADLKLPVDIAGRAVSVRACAGIALFPQDGTDAAALYENAVAAMQDARIDSKADYRFHSGTVRLRTLQRTDLEVELRSALERGDYDLNFLPIVDAKTRETRTVEALLRWPDAVLGTQPIRKIVRVAERTGLILPIGDWVFRQACETLRQWRDAGQADIRLAINLSSQEFVSEGIVERIERATREAGVGPGDLDFEIKEQMLFREVQSGFSTCRRLKELGIRIVVDDYGIGTCSLAHLSQSPVDALKIDNTFIANLETNECDRSACAAAIAMAQKLGIEVVAEGIETDYQAGFLENLGCHYLQGFLFSLPMTGSETLAYLKRPAAHGTQSRGAP